MAELSTIGVAAATVPVTAFQGAVTQASIDSSIATHAALRNPHGLTPADIGAATTSALSTVSGTAATAAANAATALSTATSAQSAASAATAALAEVTHPTASTSRVTLAAGASATQMSWTGSGLSSVVAGSICTYGLRVHVSETDSGNFGALDVILRTRNIGGTVSMGSAILGSSDIPDGWLVSWALSGGVPVPTVTPPTDSGRGGTVWVDAFALVSSSLGAGLTATPAHPLIAGVATSVSLAGTETTWSSSTVFSATGGTVSGATVNSATSATITVTASAAGTVTISDGEHSASLSAVALASAYTLTGPTSGTAGVASSNFTVQLTGMRATSTTVTPSDGGAGGTFAPTSVTLAAYTSNASATFTYSRATEGESTISVTDNAGLTDPSSITYTASAATSGLFTDEFTTFNSSVWTNQSGATTVIVDGYTSRTDTLNYLATYTGCGQTLPGVYRTKWTVSHQFASGTFYRGVAVYAQYVGVTAGIQLFFAGGTTAEIGQSNLNYDLDNVSPTFESGFSKSAFPSSWSVNQDHTIEFVPTYVAGGTSTMQIWLDGVHWCTFPWTQYVNTTGTLISITGSGLGAVNTPWINKVEVTEV